MTDQGIDNIKAEIATMWASLQRAAAAVQAAGKDTIEQAVADFFVAVESTVANSSALPLPLHPPAKPQPTGDLVERVARAIYEADDPWHLAWPWPDLQEDQAGVEHYRHIARAALAISHPTQFRGGPPE